MLDFFKTMVVLTVSFLTIYVIINLFNSSNNFEGMENANVTNTTNGIAGSAETYADSIKAQAVKLQDQLLVSKYRKDYENTIIHMDDLIGLLMIQQVQTIKTTSDPKELINSLNVLNTLKMSKESLNVTMNFLDGL